MLAALPDEAGGEVRLDAEAAEAWLRALNDARLAMGVRLEIKDDTRPRRGARRGGRSRTRRSSRVVQLSVYAYLGVSAGVACSTP